MFLFQYHGILPSKHQNYILPNVSQKRRKYFTKIKGKMVLSLLFLLSYEMYQILIGFLILLVLVDPRSVNGQKPYVHIKLDVSFHVS